MNNFKKKQSKGIHNKSLDEDIPNSHNTSAFVQDTK